MQSGLEKTVVRGGDKKGKAEYVSYSYLYVFCKFYHRQSGQEIGFLLN